MMVIAMVLGERAENSTLSPGARGDRVSADGSMRVVDVRDMDLSRHREDLLGQRPVEVREDIAHIRKWRD